MLINFEARRIRSVVYIEAIGRVVEASIKALGWRAYAISKYD